MMHEKKGVPAIAARGTPGLWKPENFTSPIDTATPLARQVLTIRRRIAASPELARAIADLAFQTTQGAA